MENKIRLNKWMAQMGLASRREADRWIQKGRISINGKKNTELGVSIDPESDQIALDGKIISNSAPPKVFWLMNKPAGFLCSRKGEKGMKTIYDLDCMRTVPFLVQSVGRLDYNTEGLLVLTNDGELANKMSHPRHGVAKMYQAVVSKRLSKEDESKLARFGVELDDGKIKPLEFGYSHSMKLKHGDRGFIYYITVDQGRNRLVRRIFEHYNLSVIRLFRYGYGALRLGEKLPVGEYRQLTSEEVKQLKSIT